MTDEDPFYTAVWGSLRGCMKYHSKSRHILLELLAESHMRTLMVCIGIDTSGHRCKAFVKLSLRHEDGECLLLGRLGPEPHGPKDQVRNRQA